MGGWRPKVSELFSVSVGHLVGRALFVGGVLGPETDSLVVRILVATGQGVNVQVFVAVSLCAT